jgi:hypothetical protein
MAVTRVTARPREHPGRADNTGEVVFYLVEFDTKGFSLWDARTATDGTTSIPADGDSISPGSNVVVTSKVATPKQESPYVALVEVTYGIPTRDLVIFPQPPSANKWNISVEAEGVSYLEPVYADRDGKVIGNSALTGFDPPLVKEYFDELITVTYTTNAANMAAWDTEIPPARGKINSDTVTLTIEGVTRSFVPETLKLGNARYGVTLGMSETGELEKQFRVLLPLIYRYDTWTRRIVDQGFYELNSSSFELEPILDANGQMVAQPVPLDGSGARLAYPATDAVLLEFDIEETTAFNTFLADIG